jgi:hypothetical protein
LADFRGLIERNRDGARKVLDALLETPIRFTPTSDTHLVLDPAELLFDVMIKVATKEIGKSEIAAALRSLVSSVAF